MIFFPPVNEAHIIFLCENQLKPSSNLWIQKRAAPSFYLPNAPQHLPYKKTPSTVIGLLHLSLCKWIFWCESLVLRDCPPHFLSRNPFSPSRSLSPAASNLNRNAVTATLVIPLISRWNGKNTKATIWDSSQGKRLVYRAEAKGNLAPTFVLPHLLNLCRNNWEPFLNQYSHLGLNFSARYHRSINSWKPLIRAFLKLFPAPRNFPRRISASLFKQGGPENRIGLDFLTKVNRTKVNDQLND